MIGRFAAAWIGRLAATCLLMAAPAAGQTRVYTNADLGRPLTWAHAPTPEELASVAARQFVPMPEVPAGPRAMTIEGDPSHGPFGAFAQSATQPLDPNWRGDTWGYWGDGVAPRYRAGQPYSAGGLGMNRRHGGGRMYSLGEPRVTAPSPFMRPGSHQPPPPPAPRNAADREQCRGGLAVAAEASRTTVALSRPSSAGPSLEAPADVRPRAPAVH